MIYKSRGARQDKFSWITELQQLLHCECFNTKYNFIVTFTLYSTPTTLYITNNNTLIICNLNHYLSIKCYLLPYFHRCRNFECIIVIYFLFLEFIYIFTCFFTQFSDTRAELTIHAYTVGHKCEQYTFLRTYSSNIKCKFLKTPSTN